MYIWQRSDWPKFHWDAARLIEPLAAARLEQGFLLGGMSRLGFDLQREAQLEALTEDVVKSSAIEGENLDRAGVRSSLARHLGVPEAAFTPADRRTEGIVEMMLDATENYNQPLSSERLWRWHACLFPMAFLACIVSGPALGVMTRKDRCRLFLAQSVASAFTMRRRQRIGWSSK